MKVIAEGLSVKICKLLIPQPDRALATQSFILLSDTGSQGYE
jgi:hypothetical protein